MPGYRLYEYLLVLSSHEELWNRIMKTKEEFSDKYKSDHAKWGKPHITLVNFMQYEMMEERIVNRLRMVAMGSPAFKVELKDFGSFPSHINFKHNLNKIINDDNKPHFIMEPHLTIARKLKPWQYEKGWLEYSNKHFTGRFIADSMTLLKRQVVIDEVKKKYVVREKFVFQNLPVATKQGELFG